MPIQSHSHVVSSVLKWLKEDEAVWLCTITSTWGSSPTPAGTLMAYCEKYGVAGTLSGGCIEEDLLEKMQQGTLLGSQKQVTSQNQLTSQHKQQFPIEMIYGGSQEEQARFVLPCGGQLHVLVEHLHATAATLEHFSSLEYFLNKRELIGRRVSVNSGEMKLLESNIQRGIKRFGSESEEGVCVEHVMGPAYQMLLIGASEVARCVAELAQSLDFSVSVWDHREEFIRNWQVENVAVYKDSPEKLINEKFNDENNAIIALAHDPRVDDFALVDALSTKAFYIGAIGSKNTCRKRNERLVNYVESPELLDKMHSPVGLDIGSKTPFEIAISVLAHVIQKRSELEKSLRK
ncbi:MAG: XdhC family protein [Thalassotalea sp.]|nr:XdhC family protein [Thalassotalea sp.]